MKLDDYIAALPDNQKKPNNIKLLSLEQKSIQDLRDDIEAVAKAGDIRTATGKTLDMFGEMYKQPRGNLNDEQYRFFILLKAAQLMSGCDHTSIVQTLSAVLNVPPETFRIDDSEESGFIDAEIFPYDILQEAGVTVKQAWEILEHGLTAGVGVKKLNVSLNVPETKLVSGIAVTQAERYTIDITPVVKWAVDLELSAPITVTQARYYNLEVE